MNYQELAKQFLKYAYQMGRHGHSQKIGETMKGEAFILIYMYDKNEPVLPGEICQIMRISSARVAAALNSLERKGLIIRKNSEEDRRKVLVFLTEKGKEQAKDCSQKTEEIMTQLMEKLGQEDAENLVRIAGKITQFAPEITCPEIFR